MAINIPTLDYISKQKHNGYVFKDLHLEFRKKFKFNKTLQKKVEENDLDVDYDVKAIRNSIVNLFGTRPGERFLFPKYGLGLEKFLFEAITQENARIIGEEIVNAVTQFESRVFVKECVVVSAPDENMYEVTLILDIPALNVTTTINSNLNASTESFTVL